MTEPRELMTIGDFARASRLTPKALRLYDDLGLVRPAEVDPFSGYRRYAPDQLGPARLVAELRLVGMPLARIQAVLDHPGAAAAREVETYWHQVEADTRSRRDMVTALVKQLRHEEDVMTTPTTPLHAAYGTSHRQGARASQQDALLATPTLFAVADGFGERDDLAAAAVQGFATGGLVAACGTYDPGSGTTLTAVTFDGATARITHVGDGRAWLVREGQVRQLTHDHTVVAGLIESGQLTSGEARSHEHRHVLNRALAPGVVADEVVVDLRGGDRLVLTTDGVHAHVDDLAALLAGPGTPQDVADAVADAVVAAGEPDNHTVVVAEVSASA